VDYTCTFAAERAQRIVGVGQNLCSTGAFRPPHPPTHPCIHIPHPPTWYRKPYMAENLTSLSRSALRDKCLGGREGGMMMSDQRKQTV
jgi:hypothetical protein